MGDPFAEWTSDEFLLAVVNGKVGVLVACADAARLEADAERLLRALFDRLLRLEPAGGSTRRAAASSSAARGSTRS